MEYDSGNRVGGFNAAPSPVFRKKIRAGLIPLLIGVVLIFIFGIFALVGALFVGVDANAKASYTETAQAKVTFVSESSFEKESCSGSSSSSSRRHCTTDTYYTCTFDYTFRPKIETVIINVQQAASTSTMERCLDSYEPSFTATVYYDPQEPDRFVDSDPQESALGFVGLALLIVPGIAVAVGIILILVGLFKLIFRKEKQLEGLS